MQGGLQFSKLKEHGKMVPDLSGKMGLISCLMMDDPMEGSSSGQTPAEQNRTSFLFQGHRNDHMAVKVTLS